MSEFRKENVLKEEKFLDDYPGVAEAASKFLQGVWEPNYSCDDRVRHNQTYFLESGELRDLVFDMAAVYHDQDGLSSVQIVLKSSTSVVTVRVSRTDDGYSAEKIVDRPV